MLQLWTTVLVRRARATLLAGGLLIVLAGGFGAGVFNSLGEGGFDDPESESARERVEERNIFGNHETDVVAVYTRGADTTADEFTAEVDRIVSGLSAEAVERVVTFERSQDPSLVSEDGASQRVLLSLTGDTQDELMVRYREIEPQLMSNTLETRLAGPYATYVDVNETASADLARAEMISLPIVLILSLLIFRGAVAALMPVAVGAAALAGAMACVRLLSSVTEVSIFAVNIIMLIGMGLAVDYALFIVSRFREELSGGDDDGDRAVATAMARTMASAGRTVLFSGLTVAASMGALLIFPQNFLKSMAYGGVAAVLIAMITALTVLPALLVVLGRKINAWPVRIPGSNRSADSSGSAMWGRIGRAVLRRPVAYLAIMLIVMGVLAAPFLGVKWGSVDHRVLPPDAQSHQAADFIVANFGDEKSTANVVVEDVDRAEVEKLAQAFTEVDGVTDVRELAYEGNDALLQIAWVGNAQTQRSQDLIADLRAVPVPDGSAVLIGGYAAATVDLISSIGAHLPWMALVVGLVMLILLFIAFGSIVLPVKAIGMNLVSIAASFGVITWIFSDGHLSGLLGFESQGFLDVTQPILMVAILFGLSMDYEVFLLSRVREEWDATGDNSQAVITGLERTGSIITSAALLLAVVIGAFATSGLVFMKLIGIGMLVALAIDATLVRGLLVPATMRLLGAWNWWSPAIMRRWWHRWGHHETVRVLPAEMHSRSSATE